MRIVVTGAGIVSALGVGKESHVHALLNEQSGITAPCQLQTNNPLPVGEVKASNDELKSLLHIKQKEVISRTSLLGITAAREALEESAITDTAQMAFISGTTVGGMDYTESHWVKKEHFFRDIVQTHSAGSTTEQTAAHIGTFAYTATLSTACSSALNAIITACNMLRCGNVKQVLAGGAESLSLFHYNGFRSLQILSAEQCRPFSGDRQGLNLGEGAAYIILESEESALQRGAHIIAYISGYGNACDAYHQTASSDTGEGAYLAMKKALQMAGVTTTAVDYVNAHGTATQNNDSSEATALQRLFNNGETLLFSSTKGYTGHATSAAGSIELVISMLAMQHGFVPANIGWRLPIPNTPKPTLHTLNKTLNVVLCNSFGFGGNDSSILITKSPTNKELTEENDITIEELSCVEVLSDADWKQFISPMVGRRLTTQMRCLLIAAKQAMTQNRISQPDAVITGTDWGCIHNTTALLNQLTEEGEDSMSPTLFMQSTHNTPSSLIAIQTANHGYNATYSHGKDSFSQALLDARMQLKLGLIQSALVLGFEEPDETWQQLTTQANTPYQPLAKAVILQCHA
ncbi:MAG: beta-ketoacyl synthase chain length factor [Paludibacteraceae bacterium]|nr:beta-ketoacyl synthase chain length factor [Paludibacteraceae bacterium]